MNTPTVLYVEDDPDHVYLLRHAFEEIGLGANLEVLNDAESAFDFLASQGAYAERAGHLAPTVVLLDINLPRISGLELLCWIRRRAAFERTAVFMLTSSSHDQDVVTAYRLGADGYILKNGRAGLTQTVASTVKDLLGEENPRERLQLAGANDQVSLAAVTSRPALSV